jgi:hypothetical protein
MTVLSLLARPRRRTALPRTTLPRTMLPRTMLPRTTLPRHLRATSRTVPRRPWGRTYRDPFFADPAAVEDDFRRLRRDR